MESSEQFRGPEKKKPRHARFYDAAMDVQEGIVADYHDEKQISGEAAKTDARVFAVTQMAVNKYEVFNSEYPEQARAWAQRWEQALDATQIDDWDPMRDALGKYVDGLREAAGDRQVAKEMIPGAEPGNFEKKAANSFTNLIWALKD